METRAALWTMVGIFVVFKLVTTIAIAIYAAPNGVETALHLFLAFHWPFILAGAFFAITPTLFWLRLLRMRRRRAQLVASEWQVDQPTRR
jgi:uncharacterized integral membrane protein